MRLYVCCATLRNRRVFICVFEFGVDGIADVLLPLYHHLAHLDLHPFGRMLLLLAEALHSNEEGLGAMFEVQGSVPCFVLFEQ